MDYALSYLILVFMIGTSIIVSKSKVWRGLIILTTFALFAFSIDKGDYHIYEKVYNLIGSGYESNYEVMFVLLSKIGNYFHLDFYHFRMILVAIELIIFNFFINRYSDNGTIVAAAYLLFSAMFDAITLRHFMASLPILFAIPILIKKDKRTKDIITYIILNIVSGLSHSSFWFFLVLLPLSYVKNKWKIIVSVILLGLSYITASTGLFFRIYALLPIREYTIQKYNTGVMANMNGIIADCIMQFIYVLPAVILRFLKKNESENVDGNKVIDQMMTINLLFFFVIPFQVIAVNFSRMQRILVIWNYVFMSKYASNVTSLRRNMLIKVSIIVYASLILIVIMLTSATNYDFVWSVHFGTNPVFNFLK